MKIGPGFGQVLKHSPLMARNCDLDSHRRTPPQHCEMLTNLLIVRNDAVEDPSKQMFG